MSKRIELVSICDALVASALVALLVGARGQRLDALAQSVPTAESALQASEEDGPPPVIGEEPAVKRHISQADIEAGHFTLEALIEHGRVLFTANFNALDGAGRPELTGKGGLRKRREMPDNFNRISGPDANACSGCHNLPATGGGGEVAVNVFVTADALPFVDFDGDTVEGGPNQTLKTVGNERNTPSIFGAGFIELLAREMTAEMHALRSAGLREAKRTGRVVSVELVTKGVSFGTLLCGPDGSIDASAVEGVNEDLVVRPFNQKGATVSLREFTNNAAIHHHGMLSVEQAGEGRDPDADGDANELTVGDITALTLFQATLPAPVQVTPATRVEREAAARGRVLFDQLQCSACHIPELPLASLLFTEPGPFNPDNDLRPEDVTAVFEVDLSPLIKGPRTGRRWQLPAPGIHRSEAARHGRVSQHGCIGAGGNSQTAVADEEAVGVRVRTAVSTSWAGDADFGGDPGAWGRGARSARRVRGFAAGRTGGTARVPPHTPDRGRNGVADAGTGWNRGSGAAPPARLRVAFLPADSDPVLAGLT